MHCPAKAVLLPSRAGSTTAPHQPCCALLVIWWVRIRRLRRRPAMKKLRIVRSYGSALCDRKWLLNDGQIQNPSAQSKIAARSTIVPRGFGLVYHSRTIFSVALCQTLANITIRNCFIAVCGGLVVLLPRGYSAPEKGLGVRIGLRQYGTDSISQTWVSTWVPRTRVWLC